MKQFTKEISVFMREKCWSMLITFLAVVMCYGKHAFSTNIDIDTEELILRGTSNMDGWLQIGRFGGYYSKKFTGGMWHNPYFNGALFLLLFSLGIFLLMFLFWRIEHDYPVLLFGLLYSVSAIWCFSIYFAMLQVELTIGLLCAIVALHVLYDGLTQCRHKGVIVAEFVLSLPLLVWAFASYQAILVFYLVAGVGMYVTYYRAQIDKEQTSLKRNLLQIVFLLVHFVIGYGFYSLISKKFFSGSTYLTSQISWGQNPFFDVVKNILRVVKATYFNDILKLKGLLLPLFALILVDIIFVWIKPGKISAKILYMFLQAGLVWSPFALIVYVGGDMPYRTKFALALYIAFTGMYLYRNICAFIGRPVVNTIAKSVLMVAICICAFQQASVNLRLWYTDDICNEQNKIVAENIYDHISGLGFGESPEVQVAILGNKQVNLNPACMSGIEMFGISNFRWDYSSPTGSMIRTQMYLRAYTGIDYHGISSENVAYAIEKGKDMPMYPADGYVKYDAEKNLILVKLSDY
ncbi:glucosyltransferase domain-containing protein [Eubacterium sp. MSJ-33]|uniref:glucosyltransferase domain-containing protein n=1 Tax=Eubacterium sp. MSJ-33 TaxID=2841528 RepID=UPI001C78F096|nr:glucosyltransferase domain-containing protein [Eubacterium sp. MSJ-33]QWT52512.1 glucosyltransferase domain-containing protein [Eubacterium sp. MSJ-33]